MRVYAVTADQIPRSHGPTPKVIRNEQIVRMHRAGMEGAEIARHFGITRERVRQIVLRDAGESVRKIRAATCAICGGAVARRQIRGHSRTAEHRAAIEARRVSRFWSRVQKGPSCWAWLGGTRNGYGACYLFGLGYAHRVSYVLTHGSIPDGLSIDHLCRNTRCVNPAHLEAVTQRENILRSPLAPAAINAAKTHCPRGHAYAGDNLVLSANGRARTCRTCRNARETARRMSAA